MNKIQENVLLSRYATFKLGGPAKFFVSVSSLNDLTESCDFAYGRGLDVFILGGGSNVVFPDSGFNGLVVKIDISGTWYHEMGEYEIATVGAGENFDDFVADTVTRGLYGLENLSGIPGSVGGAPIQNIGAYGAEAKDVIVKVRVYDSKSKVETVLSNADCLFGYRDSVFKHGEDDLIITYVEFKLARNGKINKSYADVARHFDELHITNPTLSEAREAILAIRNRKFPDLDKVGTAGSFFKNPIISEEHYKKLKDEYKDIPGFAVVGGIKVPLAWILDHILHLNGFVSGKIGAYKHQPQAIINLGGATSGALMQFAKDIEKTVYDKTKITILPEVSIVKNKK